MPIGIAAVLVTTKTLNLPKPAGRRKIDGTGAAFMAAAVACLVLLLTWGGRRYPWDSVVILGLAVGVLVFAPLFLWAETRAEQPILPLRLFRDDVFRINTVLAVLLGIAMFGAISYLPTYLQLSLGASPTQSGILMMPLMGGLMLAAVFTGQVLSRTGRYKVFPLIGTPVAAAGMYLLSLMNATTSRGMSSVYMVVLGLGIGFIMPVLVLTVQNSVGLRDMSTATAGINFFRQIGASVGTAIIGSLFIGRLTTNLQHNLPPQALAQMGQHHAAGGFTHALMQKLPPSIAHDIIVSYAHALIPLYRYLVPLLLAGFVVALFLKEKPLSAALGRGPAARSSGQQPPAGVHPSAPASDANAGTPTNGRQPTRPGPVADDQPPSPGSDHDRHATHHRTVQDRASPND